MADNMLNLGGMAAKEYLEDVKIRQRQLEAHLLHSPEYVERVNNTLKRQVTTLYLAIALMFLFQGLFILRGSGELPFSAMVLTAITSFLAIINCLMLIRTKSCLRRLNDAWLRPEEKSAVEELRHQRTAILHRQFLERHS
jgi:hypothetical protein